jgi:acyl-CoA thioesterase
MKGAPTSQQVAEACGVHMHEKNHLAQALGVTLDEVAPGRARVSLTVREDMTNSVGTCHGGVIFSLADCAFEYSCNSHNRKTVAAGSSIDYVRAARLGDRLTAIAEERSLVGRSGVYDVRVVDQNGEPVAFFRGRSRSVAGAVLPGSDDAVDREESAASETTDQSRKK